MRTLWVIISKPSQLSLLRAAALALIFDYSTRTGQLHVNMTNHTLNMLGSDPDTSLLGKTVAEQRNLKPWEVAYCGNARQVVHARTKALVQEMERKGQTTRLSLPVAMEKSWNYGANPQKNV